MDQEKLIVSKIKKGIVIDHIPAGKALKVLKILGITGYTDYRLAIVMNVPSNKLGMKDIIKIENRILDKRELELISLVAPTATINIIEDYKVIEKYKVKLPRVIKGVLKCPNPMCITNKPDEVAETIFVLRKLDPVVLECKYCGTLIKGDEIEHNLSIQ